MNWFKNAFNSKKIEEIPAVLTVEEMLDKDALEAARDALGGKFKMIIGYYLEDSANYVDQLLKGALAGDLKAVISPAHTLKSSSLELGIVEVSHLAEAMETDVRESLESERTIDNLKARAAAIEAAFIRVRPELEILAAG